VAYDEGVAQRLREAMQDMHGVSEKKMFGGIAFMVNGNMCAGVVGDTLMLRVGPDNYEAALKQPHVRPMDFTGRPLAGFVYIDPEGFEADADLAGWIDLARQFVEGLPAK
jgi:TfoX/Sxy family transcriptional regulator of competence genes